MKNIIIILFVFGIKISYAQTENIANKTVTEDFINSYNNNDYKLIFSMFSAEMQEALPLNKTIGFLTDLKSKEGNIAHKEFIKYENRTYASYKTSFEYSILVLNISVDENLKINGLLIKPFIVEDSTVTIINNLFTNNNIITKKQSKIIFKYSKIFPNQTQIAIAIIKNGDVKYYGFKRNANTLSTIENHKSVFEIGSLTKVFTSTLLAGFVIDKKIDLDEYINDYLEFSFNNDSKISFKELSNHTSGLPSLPTNLDLSSVNPANPYCNYNKNKLEEYLTKHLNLSQNLIGKYQYSNLGAGIIGYVLSKIEDNNFEKLLEKKIFSKYNMLSSTSKQNKVNDKFIEGLDTDGNIVANWDFLVLSGAGGILSNVNDLSKFVIAQFDSSNKELELTRQKTFEINDNMNIGLGWHIINSKNGNQWCWHNGGTGGYTSSMTIDAENKNGIIILSNVSAFNPNMENIDKICFELMETLEKE